MLKSDRLYFARYALDPEMELDDLELYFDDENEEIPEEFASDTQFAIQADELFGEEQDELEERHK